MTKTAKTNLGFPSPEVCPINVRNGTYTPQMSDGEMSGLISANQPWKERDEIVADVRQEQLRQRLWNGAGS